MTSLKPRLSAIFILLILFLSFAPFLSPQVFANPIETDDNTLSVLKSAGDLADTVQKAAVPSFNLVEFIKDTADVVAVAIAQRAVRGIVSDTVTWANTGFEGGPAYVTDPAGYFTNIANQTAGNLIATSSFGFLCSPIQAPQIKLALTKYYNDTYTNQFASSCTLTGVAGNIDNFYQDFNNGSWTTWFSMTQNDTNNPYGAYVDAQIQLDNRVKNALGLQNQKLDWGQGFKSKADCLVHNASSQQILDYNNGVTGPGTIASGSVPYSEVYGPGECITYGQDATPGSVVKDQLNKVLPSGLQQLVSVQDFDQLIDAVSAGLLQKYVFSSTGLFSRNYGANLPNPSPTSVEGFTPQGTNPSPTGTATSTPNPGPGPTVPTVICFPSNEAIRAQNVPVTWSTQTNLSGLVDFTWSGDQIQRSSSYNPLTGYATGTSISLIYTTDPTQTDQVVSMSVTASSTDMVVSTDSSGQTTLIPNHLTIGPIPCQTSVDLINSTNSNAGSGGGGGSNNGNTI